MNAPLTGWWVVQSDLDLLPENVERMTAELARAADAGLQVVTVEGIEFRWHPVTTDEGDLYDNLAAIHRIVHGDRCDLCAARLEQQS